MIVFNHTLKKLLNYKSMLLYLFIFIPLFLTIAYLYGNTDYFYNHYNVNIVTDKDYSNYFVITYLITLGLPLFIIISSRGTTLIQKEIDDDTFILLLSKPISRMRVYLEKALGLFVSTFLIGLLSIFGCLTMYQYVFNMDSAVMEILIFLTPSLILYLIIIDLVFTSFSLFITTVIRNRMWSFIILFMFIIVCNIAYPFFRALLNNTGLYERYNLYYYDLNYQLGTMYYYITSLTSNFKFTPQSQFIIGQFIGIFDASENAYTTDTHLGFITANYSILEYMSPILIYLFWFLASIFFLLIPIFILKKRDIS